MRNFIGAAVGILGFAAAGTAFAADMPRGPIARAPVAAPTTSWYGSFVGVHAGYGWGGHSVTIAGTLPDPDIVSGFPAHDLDGFIGGVHWGTNWQWDRIVAGFDSDFSYSDFKDSRTIVSGPVTNFAEQKLGWFSTTRVRAGYLLQDNLLLYITGGLANARAELTVSHLPGFTGFSQEKTRYGWALGGGLEYAMGPWSARLDYLHYDLGDYSVSYVPAGGFPVTASTKFSGDIVRAGVSYRFNQTFFDMVFGRR